MSHFAIGANDDELFGNQRVAVKLRLSAILLDVVRPAHLAGFFIQRSNQPVAGINDQQVAHDRGSGEDSPASIKLPQQLELR